MEGRQTGKKGREEARKENHEWIDIWRTDGGREGPIYTFTDR